MSTGSLQDLRPELDRTRIALDRTRVELQKIKAERDRLRTPEATKILFHGLYYDSLCWIDTFWQGHQVQKCPLDLWIYQEILFEQKPDLIVECGTNRGGSALFMAAMCDLMDRGEIISIDIQEYENRPQHERVTYLLGSSTSDEIVGQVDAARQGKGCVLVILDSDHRRPHVLQELEIYHRFVTPGNYLIVEDTNVNGHPVFRAHGPGPMEALDEFLHTNKDFEIDSDQEKFHLSFNPRGYLRKVS
jgi:cephalosporin hydroxylase